MFNLFLKLCLIAILILTAILLFRNILKKDEVWNFVGYQYKWNKDYVDNSGLKSEKDCIEYGDNWLKKQDSQDALYTCSSGCEPYMGELEVCKKICEYNKKGLIQCRK